MAGSLAQIVSVGRLNFSVGRPTCILSLFVVRLQFISIPISLIDMVWRTVIRHEINLKDCGGKSRSYMKAELSLTFS